MRRLRIRATAWRASATLIPPTAGLSQPLTYEHDDAPILANDR
jgi:hypothetical protein